MTRVVRAGRVTFAALSVPNYRRYYGGQAISLIGTWMQMTAQAWLVLSLTHSSTWLGEVIGLQTVPVLIFGTYGGVMSGNRSTRNWLYENRPSTQSAAITMVAKTGFWIETRVNHMAVAGGATSAAAAPLTLTPTATTPARPARRSSTKPPPRRVAPPWPARPP